MNSITVLYGGTSAEREVSLRSGTTVAAALEEAGYTVRLLDAATASIDQITDCEAIFPALHGTGGEDGTIQATLEARHIRYVGSDSESSRICFDKWQYRQLMEANRLPVAKGAIVGNIDYANHPLSHIPHVLKPINGGSSIDTFIIRDPNQAPVSQIEDAFRRHETMLLEELIEGIELTVGILGETPLPVIEIIPPSNGEFDYINKYNGATQELCPPQHISSEVQANAQALALQAHRAAGCRDLSRTDMIVTNDGALYILETNTLPGMTEQSLFPKMAAVAGMDMSELVSRLVTMALKR